MRAHCKYCHKSVRVASMEQVPTFQIQCSQCGYGLSPDCMSRTELVRWLRSEVPKPWNGTFADALQLSKHHVRKLAVAAAAELEKAA